MDVVEYKRRTEFCTELKTFSKAECIEIARILRKHGVPTSENRSGIFFDLAKIPNEVFEELLQFRRFVLQNNEALGKRDEVLKGGENE